jgi:hypothetical protein
MEWFQIPSFSSEEGTQIVGRQNIDFLAANTYSPTRASLIPPQTSKYVLLLSSQSAERFCLVTSADAEEFMSASTARCKKKIPDQ